jgi:hypothetical protein
MKILILLLLLAAVALADDGKGVILSHRVARDFDLTANPNAPQWKSVPGVFLEKGPRGEPAPGHRTEVRSVWSGKNIYFLFVCPYQTLHLKPNPSATTETNKLWEWDVAEVFIGADFKNIHQYKEFQVSPQGEWVDLDIDVHHPKPEGGWLWNSGFKVKARLDEANKVWYGEMQIPIGSIDTRPPAAGNEMRINLYRIQGPPPNRTLIAWQPTGKPNYHVPEAFGRLRLADAAR